MTLPTISRRELTNVTQSKRSCSLVREYVLNTRNKGEYPSGLDFKVYIVGCCYILGNEKYWIGTDLPDGKYFEVTYNKEKDEFYLDVYVRVHNERIEA